MDHRRDEVESAGNVLTTKEANAQDERTLLEKVNDRVEEIAVHLHRLHIADYLMLLNRPFRLIVPNLISGISRGIGIAIGVTIFTGTIIYILDWLGALELPVIGNYISRIVEYVERDMMIRKYNQ